MQLLNILNLLVLGEVMSIVFKTKNANGCKAMIVFAAETELNAVQWGLMYNDERFNNYINSVFIDKIRVCSTVWLALVVEWFVLSTLGGICVVYDRW